MCEAVAVELRHILYNEYGYDINYAQQLASIRNVMANELREKGRRESNISLTGCGFEKSSAHVLLKRKLLYAAIFICADRAYLSIQASSASTERIYGDTGLLEGV